jgi:hypothetical protein
VIAWIMARLAPFLGLALLVALTLAGVQTVRFHQKTTELAEFRATNIKVSLAREQEYTSNLLRARKSEQALINLADKAREDQRVAVKNLDVRVAGLLDSLRLARAARPAASPPGPGGAPASLEPGGTGAGLYFEDSQFLVGEAAAAQRIGLERDECRALYNAARQQVNPGEPTP